MQKIKFCYEFDDEKIEYSLNKDEDGLLLAECFDEFRRFIEAVFETKINDEKIRELWGSI